MRRRVALLALAVVWSCATAMALRSMWAYTYTPGPAAHAPLTWPSSVTPGPSAGGLTLVMFAHPLCPCTAASIESLAALAASHPGRLAIRIYFYVPAEASSEWLRTASWSQAAGVPGVQRLIDANGAVARRFGVRVSGQTMLFDASGRLRFSGGITGARGHAGDNDGLRTLAAVVDAPLGSPRYTSVFGCFIQGEPEPGASSRTDS